MPSHHRPSAEDTRARIICVAEEHFRRIGYAKTAVADIAAALGMSPANIYRYFPSKGAINNAICARLMEALNSAMREIVAGQGSAAEKLRALILGVHHHITTCLNDEHRLYDMVEVAMAENWPAIDAHCQHKREFLAEILRQGMASGEFRAVEADLFADTACCASASVTHPTLIAHAAACGVADLEGQAHRLVDLLLAALRP